MKDFKDLNTEELINAAQLLVEWHRANLNLHQNIIVNSFSIEIVSNDVMIHLPEYAPKYPIQYPAPEGMGNL